MQVHELVVFAEHGTADLCLQLFRRGPVQQYPTGGPQQAE